MLNGNLLNFGKRYKDDLWVIFDQWTKLHLGLDAPCNQKSLKRCLMHRHWLQTATYVHSRGNMTVLCLIILLILTIQLNHKFYGNLATEA